MDIQHVTEYRIHDSETFQSSRRVRNSGITTPAAARAPIMATTTKSSTSENPNSSYLGLKKGGRSAFFNDKRRLIANQLCRWQPCNKIL